MSPLSPVRRSEATPRVDPGSWGQQQSAAVPSADVGAAGSDASAGLQAGTRRPSIRGAGRSHPGLHRIAPGASKCFLLLTGQHQAGAPRFLLWFWWVAGSSKFWSDISQEWWWSCRVSLHRFFPLNWNFWETDCWTLWDCMRWESFLVCCGHKHTLAFEKQAHNAQVSLTDNLTL